MEGQPEQVDTPFEEFSRSMEKMRSLYFATCFPYYVPVIRTPEGREQIMVLRSTLSEGTMYFTTIYTSKERAERHSAWRNLSPLADLVKVEETYGVAFWQKLLGMYLTALRREGVEVVPEVHLHSLLIFPNMEDGGELPAPLCALCYVAHLSGSTYETESSHKISSTTFQEGGSDVELDQS